jgi:hypothetical protein
MGTETGRIKQKGRSTHALVLVFALCAEIFARSLEIRQRRIQ